MSNRRRRQRTPAWPLIDEPAPQASAADEDLTEFAASVAASVAAGDLSDDAGRLAVDLYALGDFDLEDRAFDPAHNPDSAHLYIELRNAGLLDVPLD
jgi:hypothetical protein